MSPPIQNEAEPGASGDGAHRPSVAALHAAAVAVLLLAAWRLRAAGLGASSLWLDDAWQALAARAPAADMRYVEFLAPGFAWMLRGWFDIVGFRESSAQMLPFVAGVALAPLAYVAAVRSGLSRTGAFVLGLLLAAAPEHATFSTRVKPYAFDALISLALIWGACAAMRPRVRARQLYALAAAAALGVVTTSAVATVGAAALLAVTIAHRRGPLRAASMCALGVYLAFAAAWCKLLRRARASHGLLLDFWSGGMISGTTAAEWSASAGKVLTAMASGLFVGPPQLWLAGLLAGAVVLAIRDRARAVLFVAPFAAAVALSTAGIAPLGGGRTDVYLLVPAAFLFVCALDEVVRLVPRTIGRVAKAAALGLAIWCVVASPGSRPYPVEDVRPLVETVDRERGSNDVVLVFSDTRYAYALYSRSRFRLGPAPDRYAVLFEDPAVHVLASHRRDPSLYRQDVAAATAGAATVWLVASHLSAEISAIDAALEAAGYFRVETKERDGALASVWSKLAR